MRLMDLALPPVVRQAFINAESANSSANTRYEFAARPGSKIRIVFIAEHFLPARLHDPRQRTDAGHRRPAAAVPQATPTVGGMAAKSEPADIDAVEPLDDSTARLARRLVAANANDADECRSFLAMLGIGLAQLA
jgi:hypothetical protein